MLTNNMQPSHFLSFDALTEVNPLKIAAAVWQARKFIAAIGIACMLLGAFYAHCTQSPSYQSTAIIQMSESMSSMKGSMMPGANPLQQSTQTDLESTLISSPYILSPVVQALHLDISASPITPSSFFTRHFLKPKPADAAITITELKTPEAWLEKSLKIVKIKDNEYTVYNPQGQALLTGIVGNLVSSPDTTFTIRVTELKGKIGTTYTARKRYEQPIMQSLKRRLAMSDSNALNTGSTGILNITFTASTPETAIAQLNAIVNAAYHRSVKEQISTAKKTLVFINKEIKLTDAALSQAQDTLIAYQEKTGNIKASYELGALLRRIASLKGQIDTLMLRRTKMLQSYTEEHPNIVTINNTVQYIQQQLENTEQQLKAFPVKNKAATGLLQDVKTKQKLQTLLLSKKQELEFLKAGIISNLKIIAYASTPPFVIPTHKLLAAIGFFLAGLLLSAGFIALRTALHRGIDDPNLIEQAFGLSTQAVIPYSNLQAKHEEVNQPFILARKNPKDITIESLRSLRTSLQLKLLTAKNNIICFSGLTPGVGKSFISENIAHVFADSHKRVLLIDGDLRKGKIHKNLALSNTAGLTTYLSGHAELASVIKEVEKDRLYFIGRGPHMANPAELLLSDRLKNMFDTLQSQYDLIIVDTAPVLAVGDGFNFLKIAGTNLVILSAGQHTLREMKLAFDQFNHRHITIEGTVFNFRSKKNQGIQYQYGYQAYQDEHHDKITAS